MRAIIAILLVWAAPAAAEEVWFDWSRERCETWDIPDTPARAWRDATGVSLVAGAERSRASRGPELSVLRRDCAILEEGAHDPDPEDHDDRVWIGSTWMHEDGRIEALAHVEYHGHRHGACAAGTYVACWRNSIVALESHDGGRTFTRSPGPPVAALPYSYDPAQERRSGYFNPSNIFRRGEHLYAFVFAERVGEQRRGACLLRRPVEGGAGDWRAWDGGAFAARLIGEGGDVCTPAAGVRSTLSAVVADAAGGFFAVTAAEVDRTSGLWVQRSDDLLHWGAPLLLRALPLLWRRDCAAPAVYAYPSLLDEGSQSANFDTASGDLWLTAVRMPLDGACRVGPERDLVAWRLRRGDGGFRVED